MNAKIRPDNLDLESLTLEALEQLRQRLDEEIEIRYAGRARCGRDSTRSSPTGLNAGELRDLLVFALGSTYLVLVIAGFLYGVYLGGEPTPDSSRIAVYVAPAIAISWMVGVVVAWIWVRGRHRIASRSSPGP